MRTERIDHGWTEEHRLEAGPLRASVLSFGGTLIGLEAPDAAGDPVNVVHRLPRLTHYRTRETNPFVGSLVGRVANRVAGSTFTLDGTVHRVEPNEGPNQLHGGPQGFQLLPWTTMDAGVVDGAATLVLHLRAEDGDQGYPGTLDVTATYRLSEAALELSMTATTDAATPVNLTSHPYWNLDGGGPLAGHHLTVDASVVLPVDDRLIPTGALQPVDGTPFDLRGGTTIGPDTPGFDHCWMVSPGAAPVATLVGRSGRRLRITTDQPALQVFLGDPAGAGLPTHVCLEAQAAPDAVNQPHLGDVVLRPGQTYRWRTTHELDAIAP